MGSVTDSLNKRKIEAANTKSNEVQTQKETEDPQSARGLEDHWEEFSEPEEELEALKRIAAAEVELMKKFENRKLKGAEMESPSTTGMEKENGNRSIHVEYSQEMEKFMNEEFDKLSRNKNVDWNYSLQGWKITPEKKEIQK